MDRDVILVLLLFINPITAKPNLPKSEETLSLASNPLPGFVSLSDTKNVTVNSTTPANTILTTTSSTTASISSSSTISPNTFTNSTTSEGLMTIQMLTNNRIVKETLNDTATLRCMVNGSNPLVPVTWEKLTVNHQKDSSSSSSEEDWKPVLLDNRITVDTVNKSGIGQENNLVIKSLQRDDNGTYLCRGLTDVSNETFAKMDLFVIEPAKLELINIELINPRSVNISWSLINDGNTPVHRVYLEMRNITETESDWVEIDGNIEANVTGSYLIRRLTPAMSYEFRLAAFNDAGQSDWITSNVTMPPDVPSPVTQLHVLSRTNETIWIGWRKPPEDNGADILEYILELRDANDRLLYNKSFQITREGASGSRLMFMFVSLVPATNYTVRVRACSSLGCGKWSDPKFQVSTLDGVSEAPENVVVRCYYDPIKGINAVNITWDPPANPRGTIVGYNVTLEGHSQYRSGDNQIELDNFKKIHEVESNETSLNLDVKPNTNYTVRICTLNKAGCGELTHITSNTMCYSSPTVPSSIPGGSRLTLTDPDDPFCRKLKLSIPRVSERNGPIKCYRIVIIKLPKNTETNLVLPSNPSDVNIINYSHVHSSLFDSMHSNDSTVGAYVADEISPNNLSEDIIIGDDEHSACEDGRIPRRIDPGYMVDSNNNSFYHYSSPPSMSDKYIIDGPLDASTNYTGFIEVRVLGPNNVYLYKQSDYFEPVLTGIFDPRIGSLSPLSPIFASLSDSAAAILFGIVCGLALVLMSVLSVICFLRTKVNDSLSETGEDERLGLTALLRRTVVGHKNGHIISNGVIGSINGYKWIGQPMPIQNLPNVFLERHANSDLLFQAEFEALPENFADRTCQDSSSPENVPKNRYPDIKCYDQTRVKLSPIEGAPGSDYINANLVEGYRGLKLYICAQGPLERTVTDFWRMIYEHKVSVIVMLTGIEEHGKIKCAQYWNDSGTKEIDNLYKVTLQSCTKYSDFIIRRFILTKSSSSSSTNPSEDDEPPKDILQFHFLLWKDFLAPEQPSWLLRFIKRVNEHYCPDKGPLLVHCSAGVGRTGTFIAIDSLVPEITTAPTINIYECVSQLRYQRNFLVQSFKQYIFVYRALMEFAQFGDTEIEICHLKDHYRQLKEQKFEGNINGVMAEFDRLNEVIEDPKSCCVGSMDMNMSKNRYDFIIPYDINRVILPPSPTKEHSSYINASFVQGYDRCLSFIVTQDPLESTKLDFWRMILEQNVSILVMLSELGEGQSKCYCYWPKSEETFDYVKVIPETEEECENYMIRRFHVVNIKSNDSVKLTQYHFMLWKSGVVPEATLPILKLIEVALSSNSSSTSPIVIHCSGGGDRSSLFVTLSSLIQQIRTDGRVDIFQTARYTRSQRPCMLQTIAQYDFIYRSLIDFIDSHNLCDNLSDTQL